MPTWVPFVAYGIAAGFSLLCLYGAYRQVRPFLLLATSPRVAIGSIQRAGRFAVKGTVVCTEPVLSPEHRLPCVWYRYRIDECRRRGRGSRWTTRVNEVDGRPFVLEDETGKIIVNPEKAEVRSTTERQTYAAEGCLGLGQWFGGGDGDTRSFLHVILVGEPAWVAGTVDVQGELRVFSGAVGRPLVVSTQGPLQVLAASLVAAIILLTLAVAAPIAARLCLAGW